MEMCATTYNFSHQGDCFRSFTQEMNVYNYNTFLLIPIFEIIHIKTVAIQS